jgi:hypothetical protein
MIGLLQSGTGIGRGMCLPIASSGSFAVCVAARVSRVTRGELGCARATSPVETTSVLGRRARCAR